MVTAVVTAAGRSERMGSPKALLDFGGTPALDLVTAMCQGSGVQEVVVVLGHDADRVRARANLDRFTVVTHAGYDRGKTSSLQAGLTGRRTTGDPLLYFPVDFAAVAPSTVRALVREATKGDPVRILVPAHGGKRGHPPVFPPSVITEILRLGEDQPLHDVVRAHDAQTRLVPVDDEGVLLNINTPEDYRRAADLVQDRRSAKASGG